MNSDETMLRQRMREEIDLADIPAAPVEAVFGRYRAVRKRQWTAVASAVVVLTVTAGGLVLRSLDHPGGLKNPGPAAAAHPHGVVFASGTVHGRKWRLAAVNLADPGNRNKCLPGVVVNGQDGDLLQPGFLPAAALGNTAFLPIEPGRPAAGFAFLSLRPGVTAMTASLGDGTRIHLRPVSVNLCDRQFRLVGLRYPPQGVRRIEARSARGRPIGYTPPSEYFNPASPLQDGSWINQQAATSDVASGQIGSGSFSGTLWRMRVSLGPDGECFSSLLGSGADTGAATVCSPIGLPPQGASLTPMPYASAAGPFIWYMGTVNARTASVRVDTSQGRTTRQPAVVGGRKYLVVGIGRGVRLLRVVLYDARGHVIAALTSFPRTI